MGTGLVAFLQAKKATNPVPIGPPHHHKKMNHFRDSFFCLGID